MKMSARWLVAALSVVPAGQVWGQVYSSFVSPPAIDRWSYPFGSAPGTESSVPIFASLGTPGFDNRDSQFLVGFTTSTTIPAGAGELRYRVTSARLHVWVANDLKFEYDGTFDSVSSSYDAADPLYTPDADIGKPVEVFGVGYRNGVTAATMEESTPFSTQPSFPPTEGIRSAYAAVFDAAGNATDVSNQVREKAEAVPMGIGRSETLTPGQLVPQGTELAFDIDLSDVGVRNYLSRSLNGGRVLLMVTSLHPATGGPGGGGGVVYPSFYTKENAVAPVLGFVPRLEISAEVYPGVDFDLDGDTGTDADIEAFFRCLAGAPEGDADFNMDGDYGTDADIESFFCALAGGNC